MSMPSIQSSTSAYIKVYEALTQVQDHLRQEEKAHKKRTKLSKELKLDGADDTPQGLMGLIELLFSSTDGISAEAGRKFSEIKNQENQDTYDE